MNRLGTLFQLNELTWSTIAYQQLRGRAMTVLFAYAIVAWNRFGALSFVAPRAPLRLILIGIYSWLGLATLVWVASVLGNKGRTRPHDAAVATAIAHVPLLAVGFIVAIVAGFARILGPGAIVSVFAFGLWMPALLFRSFRDVSGLSKPAAVIAAIVAQLFWLVGPGIVLWRNAEHLL